MQKDMIYFGLEFDTGHSQTSIIQWCTHQPLWKFVLTKSKSADCRLSRLILMFVVLMGMLLKGKIAKKYSNGKKRKKIGKTSNEELWSSELRLAYYRISSDIELIEKMTDLAQFNIRYSWNLKSLDDRYEIKIQFTIQVKFTA